MLAKRYSDFTLPSQASFRHLKTPTCFPSPPRGCIRKNVQMMSSPPATAASVSRSTSCSGQHYSLIFKNSATNCAHATSRVGGARNLSMRRWMDDFMRLYADMQADDPTSRPSAVECLRRYDSALDALSATRLFGSCRTAVPMPGSVLPRILHALFRARGILCLAVCGM